MFSLLSSQEKGFDKRLYISLRTYGGLNHIRFAKLGKEVSVIRLSRCRSGADTWHLVASVATGEESFSMTRARI